MVFTLLGLKYFCLAFVAIIGVIQAAAAYNNLNGLLFFRRHVFAYIFAGVAVIVPLVFFFMALLLSGDVKLKRRCSSLPAESLRPP